MADTTPKKPTLLSRAGIFQADDKKTEDIPIPEWGGSVRIRRLTARERDYFELEVQRMATDKKWSSLTNMRARLAVLVCVDEEDNLLFKPTDIETLSEKSAIAMERIFDKACSMNGLTAKDVEDLEKNFEQTQNSGSNTE